MAWLQTVLIFLDGVLAGVFVGSSMVEHAARTLGAPEWIGYKHAKERVFGPVMPVAFGAGLVATAAGALVEPGHGMLPVAAVLMGAVPVVTVTIHLPLNRLFQGWRPTDHAATWDADRRRWRRWNLLRTALMLFAFALVVAAA